MIFKEMYDNLIDLGKDLIIYFFFLKSNKIGFYVW